jgi:transposase
MYIGLDVHSKKTVFVAQDETGKVLRTGSMPTTLEGLRETLKSLESPLGTVIGLETGTQSAWVSRMLSSLGMTPLVINAHEVRAKARRGRQKTDSRDAFEICDGIRRDIYNSIVYVPDARIQRLRGILSRRRHFVGLRTSQVNAAKFLLRGSGLSHEAPSLNTWVAWEKFLSRPAVSMLSDYLTMHADMWRAANQKVMSLEKELEEALIPFSEEAKRLQTVPGVGLITSATFIAVIGTPDRFETSGHVASYAGLVASTDNSGDRVRHGRITKQGSSELRAMLCEAAHQAAKPRHPLNPYFTRVCVKGGYKKAVVSVAHRLLRILFQMWRKKEDFDVKKLNVIPDKHINYRTVYYRIKKPEERLVSA